MSKIIRSIVVGIVLALALGTAVHAHPLARATSREAAPAGVVERVWSWWTQMVERVVPTGQKGVQALWGREGSQMDPDGALLLTIQPPKTTTTDL